MLRGKGVINRQQSRCVGCRSVTPQTAGAPDSVSCTTAAAHTPGADDVMMTASGQRGSKGQQLLLRCEKLNSLRFHQPFLLLLLLLLRPLQPGAFITSTAATTANRAILLRGGSSATEDPNAEIMIGRGPQEPVRPFVKDLLLGRKALVTGGNRGIGEAITVALVKAGAQVCVMANSEE